LSGDETAALVSLFEMLWGQPQPGVSQEDWQAYRRLCDPESPDFIPKAEGYYALFTITVFRGNTPL